MPETSPDTNETTEAATPERPPTTRKRVRITSGAGPGAPPIKEAGPWGAFPIETTHWGLHRRSVAGAWEKMSWAPEGEKVDATEWPIADLTVDNVAGRWGAGTYVIHWFGLSPAGGRRYISKGREFHIRPETPVAAQPAPGGGGDFERAVVLMKSMAEVSRMFAQQAQTVVQPAPAQNQAVAELSAQVASLTAQINADRERREIEERHRKELAAKEAEAAELRRRLERAEDDANRSDGPREIVRPGEPIKDTIIANMVNAALADPAKTFAAIAAVPGALAALQKLLSKAQPAEAQPAPSRPRVHVAQAQAPANNVTPIRPQQAPVQEQPAAQPSPPVVINGWDALKEGNEKP